MKSAHHGIGMTSQRTRERLIQRLQAEGIDSSAVLEAIRQIPRHLFVEEALASRAYEDTALPIGYAQTISQPYIVALMTQTLLEEGVPETVLEVGTGSGYQAAVLSRLVRRVYTVERIEPLLRKAEQRFRELGMRNIFSQLSDGSWGWEVNGPYDGIVVTAAPAEIPQPLLEQLAEGGRMIIPVGGRGAQELRVITRSGQRFEDRLITAVSFVPLISGRL